jgi:hypothetical protein
MTPSEVGEVQMTIEDEIAALEAQLTMYHAERKKLKKARQVVLDRLETLYTMKRLKDDVGLSEKGIDSLRQVIGARGIASTEAIGSPDAH